MYFQVSAFVILYCRGNGNVARKFLTCVSSLSFIKPTLLSHISSRRSWCWCRHNRTARVLRGVLAYSVGGRDKIQILSKNAVLQAAVQAAGCLHRRQKCSLCGKRWQTDFWDRSWGSLINHSPDGVVVSLWWTVSPRRVHGYGVRACVPSREIVNKTHNKIVTISD